MWDGIRLVFEGFLVFFSLIVLDSESGSVLCWVGCGLHLEIEIPLMAELSVCRSVLCGEVMSLSECSNGSTLVSSALRR